jgi:hypothetical protein
MGGLLELVEEEGLLLPEERRGGLVVSTVDVLGAAALHRER